MSAEAIANSLLALALLEWARSGGPEGYTRQRAAFVLRLCHLGLQHELQLQLNGTVPRPPVARPPQHLVMPPPLDGVPKIDAASVCLEKLLPAPGGVGFRRLRRGFARADTCNRLRAAATVAMVQAIARGGQTVLSPGAERDARMHASSDAGAAPRLRALVEEIRRAATDDLNQSSASRVVGGGGDAAGDSGGPWELSLCGELLVRLEPPQPGSSPPAHAGASPPCGGDSIGFGYVAL